MTRREWLLLVCIMTAIRYLTDRVRSRPLHVTGNENSRHYTHDIIHVITQAVYVTVCSFCAVTKLVLLPNK